MVKVGNIRISFKICKQFVEHYASKRDSILRLPLMLMQKEIRDMFKKFKRSHSKGAPRNPDYMAAVLMFVSGEDYKSFAHLFKDWTLLDHKDDHIKDAACACGKHGLVFKNIIRSMSGNCALVGSSCVRKLYSTPDGAIIQFSQQLIDQVREADSELKAAKKAEREAERLAKIEAQRENEQRERMAMAEHDEVEKRIAKEAERQRMLELEEERQRRQARMLELEVEKRREKQRQHELAVRRQELLEEARLEKLKQELIRKARKRARYRGKSICNKCRHPMEVGKFGEYCWCKKHRNKKKIELDGRIYFMKRCTDCDCQLLLEPRFVFKTMCHDCFSSL